VVVQVVISMLCLWLGRRNHWPG